MINNFKIACKITKNIVPLQAKMKKVAKIVLFALLFVLVGCSQSQQLRRKEVRAERELEELQKSNIDKTLAERHGAELLDKQVDIMGKSFDEYLKNVKERLENLQKIAKGNPELEKDVQNKWNKYNKDRKDFSATKMLMHDKIEEIKQEMKK